MTNKELIKKLQETVDKYGELDVDIDFSLKEFDTLVQKVCANKDGITIYNWK